MVIASLVSNLISNIAEYDVFSERNNVYLAMADSCQKLSIMIHDHEFSVRCPSIPNFMLENSYKLARGS